MAVAAGTGGIVVVGPKYGDSQKLFEFYCVFTETMKTRAVAKMTVTEKDFTAATRAVVFAALSTVETICALVGSAWLPLRSPSADF